MRQNSRLPPRCIGTYIEITIQRRLFRRDAIQLLLKVVSRLCICFSQVFLDSGQWDKNGRVSIGQFKVSIDLLPHFAVDATVIECLILQ